MIMNQDAATYQRKISLPDLMYAGVGSRSKHKDQIISQCVVEGIGHIDEKELRKELAEVARAFPACRLVMRGQWGFKKWVADGPLPAIKTIHREWDGQFHENLDFLNSPLDLFSGPVSEIVQIISSDKTFLVFRVHHAVMDGTALLVYMLSVFRALRGEAIETYHSNVTLEDIDVQANTASKNRLPKAITPLGEPNLSKGASTDFVWHRTSLDCGDFLLMPRIVLALKEIADEIDEGDFRIFIPIDQRRHLKENANSAANLVGMITLDLGDDETSLSLIQEFNNQLKENSDMNYHSVASHSKFARWIPFPIWRILVKSITSKLKQPSRYTNSGILSSIGHIDLADISAESFQANAVFGIPIHPHRSPLFVVINSTDTCCEVVIGASKSMVDNQRLEIIGSKLREIMC